MRGARAGKASLLLAFACTIACAVVARAEEMYVVPFDVDPPIVVDGELDDWANVPNAIVLDRREQATYGADHWSGPADLSGVIHLAWRPEGLYLAAEVTDDVVQQPYTGYDIYKGDHVNIWLDWTPEAEPERAMFGEGQVHIGLSPGNLGADEPRLPPEIVLFRPTTLPREGGLIAARRTDNGYVLEAFLPAPCLGVPAIAMNRDATFEVALGDSDLQPAVQEMFLTRDTRPWTYSRARMAPVIFGDGNGRATPPARVQRLAERLEVKPGSEQAIGASVRQLPEGKKPYLFFRARANYARPAGFVAQALTVSVNGKPVEGARLANRPPVSTAADGREFTLVHKDGAISVWYTPDFDAVDRDPHYGLVGGVKACEYEFDLDGLLAQGENRILFRNQAQPVADADRTVLIADVELRYRTPPPAATAPRPAPTGEIPVVEPREPQQAWSDLSSRGAEIEFKVRGQPVRVRSRFSAPDGKWYEGGNAFYRHARKVTGHTEWIEVRDTFTNLTGERIPVMQAHRCNLGSPVTGSWLAGVQNYSSVGRASEAANPSVFGVAGEIGVGLVALNDEFRVHIEQMVSDGEIEIGDYSFVLEPGREYTAEWAIVPVARPDFWDFVNAARRMLDVNFPLKLCFAFCFKAEPVYQWSDETFRSFVENKGANFLVQSLYGVTYKGYPARATAWMMGDLKQYRDFQKRVRRLYPDRSVKTGIYYDCFLDMYEPNEERFAADRGLDSNGNHIRYGSGGVYEVMKLYIPTLENGWGKEISRWIDVILDDVGADGVYQDEFTYSVARYVYNMYDGCSADIDRRSCKLMRLKGSVPLLSRDHRARNVQRILERGAPFIANGAPHTRTLARLKFEAFTETGSMTNCRHMLLYSPVALGDHLTEREYADSYRNMLRALDHGCLFVWYTHIFHDWKAPTAYMYPFTPIELHQGYVIGEERIVTKESGFFGWGDTSEFDAYVWDRDGKPTKAIEVPRVIRDGKAYAEVRLPEGYMAILVRRK